MSHTIKITNKRTIDLTRPRRIISCQVNSKWRAYYYDTSNLIAYGDNQAEAIGHLLLGITENVEEKYKEEVA